VLEAELGRGILLRSSHIVVNTTTNAMNPSKYKKGSSISGIIPHTIAPKISTEAAAIPLIEWHVIDLFSNTLYSRALVVGRILDGVSEKPVVIHRDQTMEYQALETRLWRFDVKGALTYSCAGPFLPAVYKLFKS
jgi:hypothetical protein